MTEPRPHEHVTRFVVEVRSRPGHAMVDDTTALRRALINALRATGIDAGITAPVVSVEPRLDIKELARTGGSVTVPVAIRRVYKDRTQT